ncbi:MAG: hypothetical protein D3905_13620 [Candidatus Electrothrix sp. AS4_5]|nr:hypothetical protein [Candidatus Electrothrix gigas]
MVCALCLCIIAGKTLQVAAQNHQESEPSLVLTGTVIKKKGANAAVLKDEIKQKQYLLYEGDTLMDIVVQKIEREKIVLLRNGQEEVLFLKNRKGRGTPDTAAPRTSLAELMPPPPPPPPAPAPAPL